MGEVREAVAVTRSKVASRDVVLSIAEVGLRQTVKPSLFAPLNTKRNTIRLAVVVLSAEAGIVAVA
ncbi:MAG: hypothetical protein EAZ36_03050 [Verrucomicrobia bacterium]|nr:MAG: hypothetical protein EAZ36_03050 [Verrucomicrobiota bacterium]